MKVTIYTDGAARGNPDGPGGFGTVIHYVDPAGKLHTKEISGGYKRTTNNRMELIAVAVYWGKVIIVRCRWAVSAPRDRTLFRFPVSRQRF